MASMNAFDSNVFSMVSMLRPINELEFVPQFLESLNIFTTTPVRTTDIAVERMGDTIQLVPTTERGSEPTRRSKDYRTGVSFRSVRLAEADTLEAAEIQNIRAMGSETEFQAVQQEIADRQMKLLRDLRLTHENMRYGAINGLLVDADGSTIVDWYDAFDITRPAAIDFDLDNATPASGALIAKCNEVRRAVIRGLKLGTATVPPSLRVMGLAGDDFYDKFVQHPEYREVHLNAAGTNAMRLAESNVFEVVRFGGIELVNVRGTDDGTTVGVASDECQFFPVMPDMFEMTLSPGETMETVNTRGQMFYPMLLRDRRNTKVDVEVYSYPLFICRRPRALQRAVMT